MLHDPIDSRPKGPSLWIFIAGFAAASLLTLAAAVGTSLLHQRSPEKPNVLETPIAQQ